MTDERLSEIEEWNTRLHDEVGQPDMIGELVIELRRAWADISAKHDLLSHVEEDALRAAIKEAGHDAGMKL